jgi:hypothetical protein
MMILTNVRISVACAVLSLAATLPSAQAAEIMKYGVTAGLEIRCETIKPNETLLRSTFNYSSYGRAKLAGDIYGRSDLVFNGRLTIKVQRPDGSVRATTVTSSPDRPFVGPVDVTGLFSNGAVFPPGPDTVTISLRAPDAPSSGCAVGSIWLTDAY